MHEDLLFTVEPSHIKVYRLVLLSRYRANTDTTCLRPSWRLILITMSKVIQIIIANYGSVFDIQLQGTSSKTQC